jgi:drug/metabolite transporter (DMT)-like permease
MGKYEWLFYVALAGLSWGVYVPVIFYGGIELGGKPNARLMAILCVGVAYFLIGVVFPLVMFLTEQYPPPQVNAPGLVFSGLAGVAGAVGAVCVIFASQSAIAAGTAAGNPAAFRVFIAPLIFGLAPVINVLVSSIWHPEKGDWMRFFVELPGWQLWVGIIFVGLGAGLVLYSKEAAEVQGKTHATPPAATSSNGATSEPTHSTEAPR